MGNTVEREAPEICAVCGAPKKDFERYGIKNFIIKLILLF